jgi:hypothetical protein
MPGENIDAQVQAAIALEVIQRAEGVAVSELLGTISDVERERVTAAVDRLHAVGVIRKEGDTVYATDALNRIDEIGLICI